MVMSTNEMSDQTTSVQHLDDNPATKTIAQLGDEIELSKSSHMTNDDDLRDDDEEQSRASGQTVVGMSRRDIHGKRTDSPNINEDQDQAKGGNDEKGDSARVSTSTATVISHKSSLAREWPKAPFPSQEVDTKKMDQTAASTDGGPIDCKEDSLIARMRDIVSGGTEGSTDANDSVEHDSNAVRRSSRAMKSHCTRHHHHHHCHQHRASISGQSSALVQPGSSNGHHRGHHHHHHHHHHSGRQSSHRSTMKNESEIAGGGSIASTSDGDPQTSQTKQVAITTSESKSSTSSISSNTQFHRQQAQSNQSDGSPPPTAELNAGPSEPKDQVVGCSSHRHHYHHHHHHRHHLHHHSAGQGSSSGPQQQPHYHHYHHSHHDHHRSHINRRKRLLLAEEGEASEPQPTTGKDLGDDPSKAKDESNRDQQDPLKDLTTLDNLDSQKQQFIERSASKHQGHHHHHHHHHSRHGHHHHHHSHKEIDPTDENRQPQQEQRVSKRHHHHHHHHHHRRHHHHHHHSKQKAKLKHGNSSQIESDQLVEQKLSETDPSKSLERLAEASKLESGQNHDIKMAEVEVESITLDHPRVSQASTKKQSVPSKSRGLTEQISATEECPQLYFDQQQKHQANSVEPVDDKKAEQNDVIGESIPVSSVGEMAQVSVSANDGSVSKKLSMTLATIEVEDQKSKKGQDQQKLDGQVSRVQSDASAGEVPGDKTLARQLSSSLDQNSRRDFSGVMSSTGAGASGSNGDNGGLGGQRANQDSQLIERDPFRGNIFVQLPNRQSSNKQSIAEPTITNNRRRRLCWCCCCPCTSISIKSKNEMKRHTDMRGAGNRGFSALPNVPLEDIRSWGDSFDKLMKHPDGRKIFHEFLRCEYSDENILFWNACEEFKKESNPRKMEEKAESIYTDYISILSPKEVSLDSRVRDEINKRIKNPTQDIFDEAQIQTYTLMARDSYPRFINSLSYKQLAKLPTSSRRTSA